MEALSIVQTRMVRRSVPVKNLKVGVTEPAADNRAPRHHLAAGHSVRRRA
jgi:hypothetical protein